MWTPDQVGYPLLNYLGNIRNFGYSITRVYDYTGITRGVTRTLLSPLPSGIAAQWSNCGSPALLANISMVQWTLVPSMRHR